jgi:RHS repeat-associated protein
MTQWQSTPAIGTQTGNLYWNANGTLQSLQINDSASPQNTQNCSYIYDDVARLKSANCGSTWSQTFSYDAFGNITKAGSSIFNPGYNNTGLNNHVSGFSYDGMGNVVNDGVRTYSYDAEGRPVSVGGVTVTYDALGRVVESNNGGTYTQTVYTPGGGKFAHMNGTAVQQYYLPLAGGLTAVYNGGGLQYYRHADWLGSTRMAITPSGSVYYDGAYAPFGENYVETGTSDRSFTGQTQDTAGGIYDFLFRQQSSAQGRWLTPDPSGMAAVDITNPQTWNRYAYVANNPVSNVDPEGLDIDLGCMGGDMTCSLGDSGWGGAGGGSGFSVTSNFSLPCGGDIDFPCNLPVSSPLQSIWDVFGLPSDLNCPVGLSPLCGGISPISDVTDAQQGQLQTIISQLQNCGPYAYVGQDLARLSRSGQIHFESGDFAGKTTPNSWLNTFSDVPITLNPNNIDPRTVIHEWAHAQQYGYNLLAIPLSNLNYYQGFLNRTGQGFLDYEADRIAQIIISKCQL